MSITHDDVIKWKHFPRYWPFVRGIHRSPVNSPHQGQWRGALMFSLICAWINAWVNTREAGDLRRYGARYDVIVMSHGYLLRSGSSSPSNNALSNIDLFVTNRDKEILWHIEADSKWLIFADDIFKLFFICFISIINSLKYILMNNKPVLVKIMAQP